MKTLIKKVIMINYKLLDESVKYYTEYGFKRIESPWTVSEYIDNITKPKDIVNIIKVIN